MENIITSIEIQKNNKERVNIYVDNSYFISCDSMLVYKKSLRKGQKVDLDLLKDIATEDNFSKAKNTALKYISRCLKTESEVVKKLERAGFDEGTSQRVIEYMKSYNFVDDVEYTRLFIKEKIKKYGVTKIKYDLRNKGVNEKIVEEQLNNNDLQEMDAVINQVASKKYQQLKSKHEDQYIVKRKLAQFLLGKGYEYELINRTISKVEGGEEE
ncbi:regulatory protein [Hathewaya proteolytica DSM 3090]|uniref:Regulatory protein RecX n=1 Tax=Hathewaya proteolytica DSM 3090 TaxID=1121331 RepID=A0A1M6SH32_9CLOT|nr:recombination regulator RecX [Hathewaya proteolytica]SHK44072.1 regulatory protein [Hathewaya proteolytica DSM 3090]